jgi:type IV pilus assembly protein PilM
LANELTMCVRYHNVTFRGNRLSRAILLGGEASESLAAMLAKRLDLPCEVGDPFLGCDLATQVRETSELGRRGQWALALGLCLKPRAA